MKERMSRTWKKSKVTCRCGSTSFLASFTISLDNVPAWISDSGHLEYDDSKAQSSSGWDVNEQPYATCAKCKKEVRLDTKTVDCLAVVTDVVQMEA